MKNLLVMMTLGTGLLIGCNALPQTIQGACVDKIGQALTDTLTESFERLRKLDVSFESALAQTFPACEGKQNCINCINLIAREVYDR